MGLPVSVKIGGIEFDIKQVPPESKELDYKRNWGAISSGECLICIDQSLPLQKQQEILTHEILHGIFDYLELPDEINIEDNVLKIGKVLHQVLKDNNLSF